jgi:hypothetical protein
MRYESGALPLSYIGTRIGLDSSWPSPQCQFDQSMRSSVLKAELLEPSVRRAEPRPLRAGAIGLLVERASCFGRPSFGDKLFRRLEGPQEHASGGRRCGPRRFHVFAARSSSRSPPMGASIELLLTPLLNRAGRFATLLTLLELHCGPSILPSHGWRSSIGCEENE